VFSDRAKRGAGSEFDQLLWMRPSWRFKGSCLLQTKQASNSQHSLKSAGATPVTPVRISGGPQNSQIQGCCCTSSTAAFGNCEIYGSDPEAPVT
jgi:hypothetical protein